MKMDFPPKKIMAPTEIVVFWVLWWLVSSSSAQEVWQLQKVDASQSIVQGIDALSVRVRWRELEPRDDDLRWGYLDQQHRRCQQAGVKFVVRLMAGTNSPGWSYHRKRWGIPDPTSRLHRDSVADILARIHARYGTDIYRVHVPAFGSSAETNKPKNGQIKGTKKQRRETHELLAETYMERVRLLVHLHGERRVCVNIGAVQTDWVENVVDALVVEDIRCFMQHNALHARSTGARQDLVCRWRPNGFQMVSPSSNTRRFRGPFVDAWIIGVDCGMTYCEVYQGDCREAILLAE